MCANKLEESVKEVKMYLKMLYLGVVNQVKPNRVWLVRLLFYYRHTKQQGHFIHGRMSVILSLILSQLIKCT